MKKNSLLFQPVLAIFVFLIAFGFPAASVNDDNARTLDNKLSEVAVKVPEFGGMYLEGDELNVYLLKPEKKSDAETAIISVFGTERVPRKATRVLQGKYTFARLNEWHNRMGGLFNIEGVSFTDLDERLNRIKVGVENPDIIGAVEKELKLQGIPHDAYIIEKTEPVILMSTLRDEVRPLQGGIQIRFSNYLCTLGFNGIRAGVNGFVVNSHCTDKQGGVEGTKYYQPLSIADNYYIGTEIADPLYTREKCPRGLKGKMCRYSDSAYAALNPNVLASVGLIESPDSVNTNSLVIAGSFSITGEGPSVAGQTVNKVGRTTGWSQGTVTGTCQNVRVSGTNIVQLCQDAVSAKVGSGDSGSPVFSITNAQNDVELRGILWGGNSAGTSFIYSPIANIQRSDELGPITNCASGNC